LFIFTAMISYTQRQLRDYAISASKEWLLTDGDGGYASSTVSFMNTRRQHSLLTVSTNFPLKRFTLLNKVDEEVLVDGKSYMLGTNNYPGTIFPEGFKFLSKFVFDHFPQVTFDLDGCQITKKLIMPKGASSIYVHYENNSKKAVTLRLLPLISFRWKDSIRKAGDGFLVDELPDGVRIISEMNLPKLYLKLSQIYGTSPESHWYYDFIYAHDADLYKDDREDLYNIGFWETELDPGKSLTLAASTRDLAEFDYAEIESRHVEMIDAVRTSSGLPKRYVHLSDAASNHLAKSRAIRSLAIINGYPYGSVTVKDSLLSLAGLSSVPGRPHYESEFLNDLVTNEVGGVLPSTIDEATVQIRYEDPQIPLYLAVALKRHAEREGNDGFLRRYLPIMEDSAETIMLNNLGGSRLAGTALVDVSGVVKRDYAANAVNAAVNSLIYNLLKVIDEAKAGGEQLSSHAEIEAEIEAEYFDQFFGKDGSLKEFGPGGELMFEMALPLVVPFSPLTQLQRRSVFKSLCARFLDSISKPHKHAIPSHSCNLLLIYLTEAGSGIEACEEETARLKEMVSRLLTIQEYTNCVDGIPRCGLDLTEHNPQDLSSSIVTGEAIRIIQRLKLK
jgi:predicted glycogen debranching enzyme